ncbi:caspase family protein [Streptomyces sp. NPDC047061]|uniref:caspase family protein n=1 Tax=Streptomyces sp. NPDC047061 TaxID=3154605 RepID=UPI0034082BC4
MGRHRALLIGASDYEMRGIQPLPFIPRDLERLGHALESHGFDEVQVLARRPDGKQISANYINARVIGFLRHSRRGDTVVIALSGHGIHAKGWDYLVPEDIDEDVHPFESGCVPIDWREHLDETLAEHVIFLIDACREGIDQDSMGVAGVKEWGRQKVGAALRRKVAYLYACSPAQLSLFVRPGERVEDGGHHGTRTGESFSIFSRSVSDVIAAHPKQRPLSLNAFNYAAQDRVTELHNAYRKRGASQRLRLVTDIPADQFFFLPSTETSQRRNQGFDAASQTPIPSDGAVMGLGMDSGLATKAPEPTNTEEPNHSQEHKEPLETKFASRPSGAKQSSKKPIRSKFTRAAKRPWLWWVLLAVVVTSSIGMYFGYQWTQTRYYVGTKGEHVALYQGVSQDVAWISLSKLYTDHPEVELKYLPSLDVDELEYTIGENNLEDAQRKVEELAVQASACKKDAERKASGSRGPTLSEDEQKVVTSCDT